MASFFSSLIGNRAVKQAFYDPLGSIFNGVLSSYREGGHTDNVHVATYDQGGWLPPGLSLAMNKTGRPERVMPPGGGEGTVIVTNHYHLPQYVGDPRDIFEAVRNMAVTTNKHNYGDAFTPLRGGETF